MPTSDTPALAVAARRAGDAYVDFIASVRYHRSRLAAAFDREEAGAKLRRREGQARRAFAAMVEALHDLADGDLADGDLAQALAIFDDVVGRARAAREPDPEPEVMPC
jgi:hypothetical protein